LLDWPSLPARDCYYLSEIDNRIAIFLAIRFFFMMHIIYIVHTLDKSSFQAETYISALLAAPALIPLWPPELITKL
jgi:hypothetical protein